MYIYLYTYIYVYVCTYKYLYIMSSFLWVKFLVSSQRKHEEESRKCKKFQFFNFVLLHALAEDPPPLIWVLCHFIGFAQLV